MQTSFDHPETLAKQDDWLAHSAASRLVESWARKLRCQDPTTLYMTDKTKPVYRMTYPGRGFPVTVWFVTVKDHPELIHIGSLNWRAENEVSGTFKAEDGRAFYRALKTSGFEGETEQPK